MSWLGLLAGCSLVALHERSLERSFERAGLERRVADVGPATMRWWRGGEGPPLVLVHGFGGDGTTGWAKQLPLVTGHRVIIPDLVWFGGSRARPGVASLDQQLEALGALLRVEGIEAASWVGISYGGFVAAAWASANPDQVVSLVLVDSPGIAFSDAEFQAFLRSVGASEAADVFVPTDAAGVQRLLDVAHHRRTRLPRFLLRDTYRHMFSEAQAERRLLLADLVTARPRLAAAWDVRAPTLVVWGAHDPVFPVGQGRALAAAIPGAELVILPDTAHAPNLESPSLFNRAVRAFLEAHR